MINLRPILDSDQPDIEMLLDRAFGPDRQSKTTYVFRDGVPPIAELGRVALVGSQLRGAISYWPVRFRKVATQETNPALLLGPLAVDPDHRGEGVGIELMQKTLELARQSGHRLVILVGDLDYYERVGFHRDGTADLRLPGPVDQDRVLMIALQGEDLGKLNGTLESVRDELEHGT
jgi:predicted N-acetyltransferase YhbS